MGRIDGDSVPNVVDPPGVLAGGGCGGARGRRAAVPPTTGVPGILSVGVPVRPRTVWPLRGTLEVAASPVVGGPRSPGFRLLLLHAAGSDPRDACAATAAVGIDSGDADGHCTIRVAGQLSDFTYTPGVPDRSGRAPTVVAGVSGAGVSRVELDGPGGLRTLPLSAHRAFLALFADGVRGRVRLIGLRAGGGTTVSRFSLPCGGSPGTATSIPSAVARGGGSTSRPGGG